MVKISSILFIYEEKIGFFSDKNQSFRVQFLLNWLESSMGISKIVIS